VLPLKADGYRKPPSGVDRPYADDAMICHASILNNVVIGYICFYQGVGGQCLNYGFRHNEILECKPVSNSNSSNAVWQFQNLPFQILLGKLYQLFLENFTARRSRISDCRETVQETFLNGCFSGIELPFYLF
jgi:hypothetical protein